MTVQFLRVGSPRRLAGLALVVSALVGCKTAQSGPPAPALRCGGDLAGHALSLDVAMAAYPDGGLAQDKLRSDISTQGQDFPELYAPRLRASLERHRVGKVLIQLGSALRGVVEQPGGAYRAQVDGLLAPYAGYIDSVIAAGGNVQLQIHCSTPAWLATYPYPHSVQTGINQPSDEPVSGCSAPKDLTEWRAIMRAVGDHFQPYADKVSFSIASEPDNYFAGSVPELLGWYTATARGLLDSTGGARYRFGGLTMVGHTGAELTKAAPTLQGNTVTFTPEKAAAPITRLWIEHSAREGLPLHLVTLHRFGGSPVPAVGTFWARARHDISAWLEASGYPSAQVEVLIEDWPQWAPYTSNDTEYFAAHTASGIISMLDLSLREGAPVRPVQGFLFEFGFTPKGDAPGGFSGRVGLSNKHGVIKPVFNMNSLLRHVEGTLTPVASSDPFVHAIAATGPGQTTVLVVNQIPLEMQSDRLYELPQFPILENLFSAEDLTSISYDQKEVVDVFFGGVDPGNARLLEAFLAEPSSIDLNQLSWPPAIKQQWEERRRVARLGREKRVSCAVATLTLGALPAGRYRLERYVVDSDRANASRDRGALDKRLKAAEAAGRLAQEVLTINQEYDAETGKQADTEVVVGQPGDPVQVAMEPNSVHVLRFTAIP